MWPSGECFAGLFWASQLRSFFSSPLSSILSSGRPKMRGLFRGSVGHSKKGERICGSRPVKQASNQAINQWNNQSVKQPINEWINQSINQSINQPTNQSINQSINQSSKQASKQAVNQASNRSSNLSMNQPVSQATVSQTSNQSTNQSVNQAIKRAMKQTSKQSINQSIHQSATSNHVSSKHTINCTTPPHLCPILKDIPSTSCVDRQEPSVDDDYIRRQGRWRHRRRRRQRRPPPPRRWWPPPGNPAALLVNSQVLFILRVNSRAIMNHLTMFSENSLVNCSHGSNLRVNSHMV